jgi:hypothetical protein
MDDAFEQFLYQANTRGYGSVGVNEEKLANGEHIIGWTDGEFEFKDVYYGGEPYAGQEVIFRKGRAFWAMQYRGFVEEGEDLAPIYAFLGKVLTGTRVGLPRGIDGTSEGEFEYGLVMKGDLAEFEAVETIKRQGRVVYSAKFLGGRVDLRREEG